MFFFFFVVNLKGGIMSSGLCNPFELRGLCYKL